MNYTTACPVCKGTGEFEESYRFKAYGARLVNCEYCRGTGGVSPQRARELRNAKPRLPKNWVPS